MMEITPAMAQRLRMQCRRAQLHHKQLANETGLSEATICSGFTGRRPMSQTTYLAISAVLEKHKKGEQKHERARKDGVYRG